MKTPNDREKDKEKYENLGQYNPVKTHVQQYSTMNEALTELLRFRETITSAPKNLVDQILRFVNPGFTEGLLFTAGGEAFVFWAKDMLGKAIAVKVSFPSYPGSEGVRVVTFWDSIKKSIKDAVSYEVKQENVAEKRFIDGTRLQNEIYDAIIAAKIDCFAVPKVLAINPEPLWVVMDWSDGVPSLNWLKDVGKGVLSAMYAFLNLVKAVSFCHEQNIIHRDIKPQNVLVGEKNKIFLVDWTSAKKICDPNRNLTVKSVGFGTAPYSSPTQMASAVDASIPDDIYSLGFTYVAFVLGKDLPLPENKRDNYSQLQAKFINKILKDERFPAIFHSIFIKCTHWDISQRYQSTAEIINDVEDLIFQLQNTTEGREVLHLPDTIIPHYVATPPIEAEADIPTMILPPPIEAPVLDSFDISVIANELSQKFVSACKKKNKTGCVHNCESCSAFNQSIIRIICETIAHLKKGKYI